jgi:hypothetical protein
MIARLLLLSSVAAPLGAVLPLAESVAWAQEPTTADCLAASDASTQLDSQHKLQEERARLLVCASETCPADIRKECLTRVDQVNAQLPTVVFSAKDGKGADLSAVTVTMDGEVLTHRLEGTALTIDPGEHAFVFETTAHAPVSERLVIVEGQKDRREAIVFGRGPSVPPAPPPDDRDVLGAQKVLALLVGGAGIVGLGVGTAFGLSAISKRSDAQSVCASACSSQDGVNRWSDAVSTGNAATVAFVVGGLGVVGGVALWLTAPSAKASTVQLGLGVGTLRLQGSW